MMKTATNAERVLTEAFFRSRPYEAARLAETLPLDGLAAVLDAVDPEAAASVLEGMSPPIAAAALSRAAAERAAAIVGRMALDAAVAALRSMESAARERILLEIPPSLAERLEANLRYPPGTAGALVHPNVASVATDLTAGEALDRLLSSPFDIRYYVYATDRNRMLVGVLTLRELLVADRDAPVASIMKSPVAGIPVDAREIAVTSHPAWTEFHALPVTDEGGALVGVIRYETLRRLERERRTDEEAPVVDLLLALGEVWWSACGSVFGEAVAERREGRGG